MGIMVYSLVMGSAGFCPSTVASSQALSESPLPAWQMRIVVFAAADLGFRLSGLGFWDWVSTYQAWAM